MTLAGPAQAVVTRIATARQAKGRTAPTLIPELQIVADRGAVAVARGDWSLKTAAHQSAKRAVGEIGRHVWVFATECADPTAFGPPPMTVDADTLLLGAAAAVVTQGRTVVMLVVAEPGSTTLAADRFGGGPGGTLPTTDTYAHPVTAQGACGADWPAANRPIW